ncbi:MAG: outer membrane beta-barrel protein [Gemmatimonadaceae bacterium]
MRNLRRIISAVAAVATITSLPLAAVAAQAPESGTVLHVAPYAGYMIFGNYLNGPLGTTLSNAPGMIYGTQVGLSLSPDLSLVGNIGYSSADMKVGIPFLGGVTVGNSSTLLYDAGLEYNLGATSAGSYKFSPFVEAGVGAMKYDISASIIDTHSTNFAANIGLGADFGIGKGLALRVLAKDYIGKFNFQDATGLGITGNTAHNVALTAGLRFDF